MILLMIKSFKKGFSLFEVIISVTVFSLFFSFIYAGVTSLISMEMKKKNEIFSTVDIVNQITTGYYCDNEKIK